MELLHHSFNLEALRHPIVLIWRLVIAALRLTYTGMLIEHYLHEKLPTGAIIYLNYLELYASSFRFSVLMSVPMPVYSR
jgi:hypothetical protein